MSGNQFQLPMTTKFFPLALAESLTSFWSSRKRSYFRIFDTGWQKFYPYLGYKYAMIFINTRSVYEARVFSKQSVKESTGHLMKKFDVDQTYV